MKPKSIPKTLLATIACLHGTMMVAGAQNRPRLDPVEVGPVETFVSLDKNAGQLPEGVATDRRGNVYVSLAPLGQIYRFDRSGAPSPLTSLGTPPFPGAGALGLAIDLRGNVYVAMATFEGDSHGVWRIRHDGTATRLAGSELIGFPNALAFDELGNLYVTDSLVFTPEGPTGRVWRIPPGGVPAVWSEDPLFWGIVNPFSNPIGANGIAYRHGRVIVANSTKRHLVEIRVRRDGSAGTPALLARMDDFLPPEVVPPVFVPVPPLIDGVTVDSAGNLYVLVVGQHKLVRLPPDGSDLTVLADFSDGLQLPASAAFGTGRGDRSTLFLTNFVFLAGLDNAAVLAIDVGVPGPPLLGLR